MKTPTIFTLAYFFFLFSWYANSAQNYCPKELTASLFKKDACLDDWQKMLMERVGCEVNWLPYIPVRRKLEMLKSGKLDFAFGMTKTPEREMFGKFTNDIAQQYYSIMAHSDSEASKIKAWCDDKMKTSDALLPLGSFIHKDVEELAKSSTCVNSVVYAPLNSYQAVEMLKKKRADFTFYSNVLWNRISEESPQLVQGLTFLDIKLWQDKVAILVAKHHSDELVNAINEQADILLEESDNLCGLDKVQ